MGMDSILGGGDSHGSNITSIGEMFDPMSYITPEAINPHTYSYDVTTSLNEGLSNVTGPLNQFMTTITPGKEWLDSQVPILQQWNETVENRPVDAAGIVAALYGGAAAGGALGAGAGGASSATPGFTSLASSSITPTFQSGLGAAASSGGGIGGLGSAGTAYGSAMLGGAGSAGASNAAMLAGGGIGGLGQSGAAAGMSAITPTLADPTLGSYMGQLYDKAKEVKNYYDKGRQLYDTLNPEEQPQQPQAQSLQEVGLYDPYPSYMMAKALRGF